MYTVITRVQVMIIHKVYVLPNHNVELMSSSTMLNVALLAETHAKVSITK